MTTFPSHTHQLELLTKERPFHLAFTSIFQYFSNDDHLCRPFCSISSTQTANLLNILQSSTAHCLFKPLPTNIADTTLVPNSSVLLDPFHTIIVHRIIILVVYPAPYPI